MSARGWTPSKRMRSAARAEQARIEREIEKASKQQSRLEQDLASVAKKRAQLEEELTAIGRFVAEQEPTTAQSNSVDASAEVDHAGDRVLRGAQIREYAVRLVCESPHAEEGIHYRSWFELLTGQGVVLAGKDPLATFLTQVSRSPVVTRSTEPGVYRIDREFPEKAAARIHELRERVAHLNQGHPFASIDEIENRRAELDEVMSELRALQRAVDESERSLQVP